MVNNNRTTDAASKTTKKQIPSVSILQRRLQTGLGNPGGSKGSLTRCAVALAMPPSNKRRMSPAEKETLRQMLQSQKLEFQKLLLQNHRLTDLTSEMSSGDFHNINIKDPTTINSSSDIQDGIQRTSKRVRQLATEISQQREQGSCLVEYESLAKLLLKRHPQPTVILRRKLSECRQKCQEAQQALATAKLHTKIRQTQIHWVLQSILDLQQSLQEPLTEEGTVDTASDLDKNQSGSDEEEEDGAVEEDQMEVDADSKPEGGKDGEEDLYDDL